MTTETRERCGYVYTWRSGTIHKLPCRWSKDEHPAPVASGNGTHAWQPVPAPPPPFQCAYHLGPNVHGEEPVSVDVTHRPGTRNPEDWQHTGNVCGACRRYLGNHWRRCRCA